MKGFISLGKDTYINIDFIDNEKSYYDGHLDKYVIFDIYGTRYLVDKKLIKGKSLKTV